MSPVSFVGMALMALTLTSHALHVQCIACQSRWIVSYKGAP